MSDSMIRETVVVGDDLDFGTHGRTVIHDMLFALRDSYKAWKIADDLLEQDSPVGEVFMQAHAVAYHRHACAQNVIDAYNRRD